MQLILEHQLARLARLSKVSNGVPHRRDTDTDEQIANKFVTINGAVDEIEKFPIFLNN